MLSMDNQKKCLRIHTFSDTKGVCLDGSNHLYNFDYQSQHFVKYSRDHRIISSRLLRIVVTKEGEVGCECEH